MEVEEWKSSCHLELDSNISDEESRHLKHLAKIRLEENYRISKIHSSIISLLKLCSKLQGHLFIAWGSMSLVCGGKFKIQIKNV